MDRVDEQPAVLTPCPTQYAERLGNVRDVDPRHGLETRHQLVARGEITERAEGVGQARDIGVGAVHEQLGRAQALRDRQRPLEIGDAGLRFQPEHFHVVDAHAGVGEPPLHGLDIEWMAMRLSGDRHEAQADVLVARLRGDRDLLVMRQLEDGERRKADLPRHAEARRLKWASMRTASASRPVKSLKAPSAWPTFMCPPSMAAQPVRRAASRSGVSSGT